MEADSITQIASLIGEAGRIRMLTVLLDGSGHSASELAMAAAVSPQTASSHLSKLSSGGLVVGERHGRQRLFRLKNADVAAAIESLGALAGGSGTSVVPEIRFARTCYDHLAGVLAIALRNELLRRGLMHYEKRSFIVTPSGIKIFGSLGVDVDGLLGLRRSFAYKCLDWTERDHHIGGALGSALLTHFLDRKWLARMLGSRAVRLTHAGERGFENAFGLRCGTLRTLR